MKSKCVSLHKERERKERESAQSILRERSILHLCLGEREKREREKERENHCIVLRLKTMVILHKRERFWREKKSKPIMIGYHDRVA